MSRTISIEEVPLNRFHRLLSLRSSGGSFVDGYVLSIIGVTMPALSPALGLNSLWESLIAISALIGIFFGGFLGGYLTDRLGRRFIYFIGPTLFAVCSISQLWVESALTLFLLRLLIGIGVGIEYPVATAFLVEFLPKRYRGPRLAGLTICWFAGAAVAYITGEAILQSQHPEAWRIALASSTIIALLLFVIRLGTPESARWLLKKGRKQEAEAVIKRIFGPQFGLQNLPQEKSELKLSFIDLLRSGYGKRMFFVATFWTCSVIPVFAVYAFAPKVLDAMHLSGDWAAYGSIAITTLFVVGCIIATWLVNRMGRRSLLLNSLLWSALALLLLGWFPDAPSGLVLLMFGGYAVLVGGAQVLQLVYPNEIFPTEIRAGAVGFGTSMSRIGAMVGTYLVPMSLTSIGIGHTMFVAAGITFFALLVSWWLAPETNGLSLDDAASLNNSPQAAPSAGHASNAQPRPY
ncbi:MFS transporter [Pseudomonas sp. DCB_AW]|uniref:MFS transporter n=1 Tax=Pseudomonas sp. DCB_AW TaxID=2993596 RepID=UPI00224955BA|nr:MFS transporter [Pseudomonas sp. DCB_AW]MCX2684683.1 MFS transporter [Pseudomonas sp. DCB_AW]